MIRNDSVPGQKIELHSGPMKLGIQQQSVLVSTNYLQIIHIIVPPGRDVPTHEAQGEIILHCLEGRVSLSVQAKTHELHAGQLLYLAVNEPFSIHGIEHSSVLATIVSPKDGENVPLIGSHKAK